MQQELIKEYNQMKLNFAKNYKTTFLPVAQKYEKIRKILAGIIIGGYLICALIFLYTTFRGITHNGNNQIIRENGKIVRIVGRGNVDFNASNSGPDIRIFLIPFIIQGIINIYANIKIKKEIMPEVCKCIGNLSWQHGHYENPHVMSLAKLIPENWNRFNADDVIVGQHKDVRIDMVEAKYAREKGSGKNRSSYTYFKGAFIVLEMNKKFKGHTIIKPDKLIKTPPSPELKLTTLEDVTFEKKYDVFTDDEIEARYLITTSFMDRLNELKVAFSAKETYCAFYGGNLIIAFGGIKNLFTVFSLFKRADDSKQYTQMFEEFLSIIKIIDHFKLNEKIGL